MSNGSNYSSFVPPRLIPPPVDASHIPGIDRPDTMGDPTGFGEARVMGVRVENADADKMDSTLKLEKHAGEYENMMNVLHGQVHAKMSAPQREAHFKSIEAEFPRAAREVSLLYPEHAKSIAPYYRDPSKHARPLASVKKSTAERLVFANAYVHTMQRELAKASQRK